MLPVAFFLKSFMLPMKKLREILASEELPPGADSGLSKERKELFEKNTDEEKRLFVIVGKTFKPMLMVCGCYNSIAIYGMMFSIMSGSWQYILPFVFLAAIATLTACPDPEKLFDKLLKKDEYNLS